MTEYCVCGHLKKEHKLQEFGPTLGLIQKVLCEGCCGLFNSWQDTINPVHPFKLDNLKLIEDLAKAKGLV